MTDTLVMAYPAAPSPPRYTTLAEELAAFKTEMYERLRSLQKRVDEHEEEINELDGIAETSRHGLEILTRDVKHLTNAMTAQLLPLDTWAKEVARLANGFESLRSTVEGQAVVLRAFAQTQQVHADNHALLVKILQRTG